MHKLILFFILIPIPSFANGVAWSCKQNSSQFSFVPATGTGAEAHLLLSNETSTEVQKYDTNDEDFMNCDFGENLKVMRCRGGTRMSPLYLTTEKVTEERVSTAGQSERKVSIRVHFYRGRPLPMQARAADNKDQELWVSFPVESCRAL